MSPRISVSVRLTGKALDVDAVEGALGIRATKTWRLGDAIQGTRMTRKQDGWEFRTSFQAGYLIDEGVADLHRMIGSRTLDLRRLCDDREYAIEVVCIVEMIDETAGLALPAHLVSWLADLRAAFQIDTYITAK